MKTNKLFLIFSLLLAFSISLSGQCNDCNSMYNDGIESDDGSPADGVQTSKNCGCGKDIQGACAIVSINLNGNPYYDPSDPSCGLTVETQESGNFSIYFLDNGCSVNCSSPDFVVGQGSTISVPSSSFSMMVCKNGGNAGRRDFNFSISCSTVENCVNGIDDDNNGFVDCDDPGCNLNTSCNYAETSTANDGGMESNNRLAEKITKRNFERSKQPVNALNFKNPKNLFSRNNYNTRNELTLGDFIALNALDNSSVYDNSPSDLVSITNATEILGYDIFRNENRIASVLSIETFEQVYEHTKYICDRLAGSAIDNIWDYAFGTDYKFIITKFTNYNNEIEYNCNFSLIEKHDGTFVLESHWNLSDYSQGLRIYNFQIWANHITNLEHVVLKTLDNIFDKTIVSDIKMGASPDLYIMDIEYKNGIIKMNVHNGSNAKEATLTGISTDTETSVEETFNMVLALSGEMSETITIPTEGVYDISFSIQDINTEIPDVVYVADGAWGLEFALDGMLVANYEILKNEKLAQLQDQYIVERNVFLESELQGELEIFRSFQPNFKAIDLSDMNTLNFTASGKWDAEVVLVSDNIELWEDQPRTSIRLSPVKQKFNLNKELFSDAGDWEALKMIVFKVKGPKYNKQLFSLAIEDVYFSNEENTPYTIPDKKLLVSPNPMLETATIRFNSETFGTYYFELSDLSGQVLESFSGHSVKGVNTIKINNNSYRQGIYVARIVNSDGNIYGRKILVL